MTLAKLHKKKPIDYNMVINIYLSYSDFVEYIKHSDYYEKKDDYKIAQKDTEYIREVACTIYTNCNVFKTPHYIVIAGFFEDIKKYFDLETLEILEIIPNDIIITEYRPI